MTESEIEGNVVAKYVEGLSAVQISSSLGIPIAKVKKILDKLKISKTWLEKNPFIQFGLNKEASDWKKIEWKYEIELY